MCEELGWAPTLGDGEEVREPRTEVWRRSGALTMGFDGKKSTLKDPELCPALLDVYLGASPISGAAKDGVASGFAATFADGACTVKKAPPAEAAA